MIKKIAKGWMFVIGGMCFLYVASENSLAIAREWCGSGDGTAEAKWEFLPKVIVRNYKEAIDIIMEYCKNK